MKTVAVQELHDNLPSIGQLIDVREADEFAAGHVPTAINYPLSQINTWLVDLNVCFCSSVPLPNGSYTVP